MRITLKRRTFIAGLAAAAFPVPQVVQASIPSAPDLSGLPADKRAVAEATYVRTMAALPYKQTTVKGGLAFAEWRRLKALGKGWPVIVGDDEALDRLAEQYTIDDPAISPSPILKLPPPRTPAAILKDAERLTFPQDLGFVDKGYPLQH